MKKFILTPFILLLVLLINCEESEEDTSIIDDDGLVSDPTENYFEIPNALYIADDTGSTLSQSSDNGTWFHREFNFYSDDKVASSLENPESRVKIQLYSQTIGLVTGTFDVKGSFDDLNKLYAIVYFEQENNWEYYSNNAEVGQVVVTKLSGTDEYEINFDLTVAFNQEFDIPSSNKKLVGNFTGTIETVTNNP